MGLRDGSEAAFPVSQRSPEGQLGLQGALPPQGQGPPPRLPPAWQLNSKLGLPGRG